MSRTPILAAVAAALLALAPAAPAQSDWLSWRGPDQTGTSRETGLPAKVELQGAATWTVPVGGRGTPVVADGHVYAMACEGEGAELQEVLLCLDEKTGERLWDRRFTDFLNDVIYYRFAIGSPTVDPQSRDVYCLTTAGLLNCFTGAGELRWQVSMMSEYGRLTFPNGRTGSPLVVEDRVIVHVISSSWGDFGPAEDRFYAFDKATGKCTWSCGPGDPPKDNSFSFPVVADLDDGRKVLYAGLGGGHFACIDARTGDPLWKYPMAIGGINASALLHKDLLVIVHGVDNLDDSTTGRMVGLKRGATPKPGQAQLVLDQSHEAWRNDLESFSSSPVLAGDRVYLTDHTGELHCVAADTGAKLWHLKLAPDQIHASPAFGDGKLYVPMNNGAFFVVEPSPEQGKVLQEVQLEGNCLGAPAIAGGRVFVHTTKRLYAFGGGTGTAAPRNADTAAAQTPGAPVRLQVVPADCVLRQGATEPLRVLQLDAAGRFAGEVGSATFDASPARGTVFGEGTLAIAADAPPGAMVVRAEAGGLKGAMRLRIVPRLPYTETFTRKTEDGGPPALPPPGHWLGARPKWEITTLAGEQVLARKIDNPMFQRTLTLIGHPGDSNYTIRVDVMTDGNRRMMSAGGVVNQRYLIALKGNHQTLEVSSTDELLKVAVPFAWQPKTWYRLAARVDLADDGSGVVRAKAWPRDGEEPQAWTIEVPHRHAHRQGSPGVYGFTPQSRFRVYLDNLTVTPND